VSVWIEVVCDGCGATRGPVLGGRVDDERAAAGDDGWADGTAWGRADVCGACADDLRHGRPCGTDALRGGLCDEVAS
jgi:hypothetical protein